MHNHFRAVGFPFDSQHDLETFCVVTSQLVEKEHWMRLKNGAYYLFMGPDNGVEWIGQFDKQANPLGGNPHFSGDGRVRIEVTSVHDLEDGPLEAVIVGTMCDEDDEPSGPPVPITIPDYAPFQAAVSVPRIHLTVQVAAFAEGVEFFASEEDFRANEQFKKMSTDFYIPTGTFTPDGKPVSPPQPRVLMAGRVLTCESRTNSFSNLSFWAMRIECQSATFDVVAAPEALNESPTVGGILAGSFYLSGRLIPDARRKQAKQLVPEHPFSQLPELGTEGANLLEIGEAATTYDSWAVWCLLFAIGGLFCVPLALPAFGWSVIGLILSRNTGMTRRWMFVTAAILGGLGVALMALIAYRIIQAAA